MEYIYSAMILHSAGKKITEENIKKAIKQQGNPEKGSCVYDELQDLKEDLVVFKIVKSEDKRHFPT